MMKAVSRVLSLLLAGSVVAGVMMAGRLAGADDPAFEKSSLAWRTALHFDPGAEAPLTSLAQLYQRAGRMNELLSLYAAHLTQFPSDEGAKVVLARLYLLTADSRAEEFIHQAIATHPRNALLAYARAQWLQSKLDPGALAAFDQAVALETAPARRAQWLGDLLTLAVSAQREDLISARLTALAKEGAFTPQQRLQWARQTLERGFSKAAAAVLEGESFASLQGDDDVEARFTRARVALANNRRADASQISRELLDKLAADHWRYREALTLRWQSVADDAERARLLNDTAQPWKATPNSESAALAYGDLLLLTEAKTEALRIWHDTLTRTPTSRLLEERILNLLEQTHQDDALLNFLAERLKLQPEREDLGLQRARALLVLGRIEEGISALDQLLAKATPAVRTSTLIQTARWLRVRQLFAEGARVLESLISRAPQSWDARKELAELYLLLKRPDDMERLFTVDMAEDVSVDVRLEVAQFLIAKKMWRPARHLLESWVSIRPAEFDARLLLAKVNALLGDEASASRLLAECRALSDTDARYAAWLAVAWEQARDAEKTAQFTEQERARLWPSSGVAWDAPRLSRLSLLAQQTMQPNERADAEKLLREILAVPDLQAAQRRDLRQQLIQVIEAQTGREKDLETEIIAALKEPGALKGDLQVRLALMYHAAQRLDLARAALVGVNPAECQDAALLGRAAVAARGLGLAEATISYYARLVRLQPDERLHWNNWIGLLVDRQDEATLRLALRESLARAKAWKLSAESQDLLRRHLAASYWRSVARLLAQGDKTQDTLDILEELERTELSPQRRLWAVWVRGMVARQRNDAAALANVQSLLDSTAEEWVRFPDGLSLSLAEARKLLASSVDEKAAANDSADGEDEAAPLPPLSLSWAFSVTGAAELQRWDLSADGKGVLVADSQNQIYLLDRTTGKLRWRRGLPKNADAPPPVQNPNLRGDELISYPPEWVVTRSAVCIASEGALFALNLKDGSLMWQVSSLAMKNDGCLAWHQCRVLWWNVAEARLDALDETTGRLLWTRALPQISGPRAINPQNPQWLGAGMHASDGKVMVWGDGSAVLRVEDGTLLWRASPREIAPSFPLELTSEDQPSAEAPLKMDAVVVPWTASSLNNVRARRSSSLATARTIHANPLAVPGYGFPGMYGNAQPSPWIYWGAEQTRRLRGDGIWTMGSYGGQRYSILGLPSKDDNGSSGFGGPISIVGFAGHALIGVTENAVLNFDPVRGASMLWINRATSSGGVDGPMPNAALAGRTLLLASRDTLRIQDTASRTVLWEGGWPDDAQPLIKTARQSFQPWSSTRWTSRGLFLYNGQGRTLTVDWKGLSAKGDWIVPVGTQTLIGLRGSAKRE